MKNTKKSEAKVKPPLEERASKTSRLLYFVITGAFIAGLIYVPLRAIFDVSYRENTGYQLMIFQLIMGLVALNLPALLTRRYRWKIPNIFMIIFFLFMLAAVVLGEVAEFYYRFPFWDDILHLTSSMMFGMIGFSMIDILNKDRKHNLVSLSPIFVAIFSVSFAVLIGALWEIYEFTFDGLLGLNMQKFAVESLTDGEKLIDLTGRDALTDTMQDLIIDLCGAVISSTIGYISLKLNKGWLNFFKIEVFAGEEETAEAVTAPVEAAENATPCEENESSKHPNATDEEADANGASCHIEACEAVTEQTDGTST